MITSPMAGLAGASVVTDAPGGTHPTAQVDDSPTAAETVITRVNAGGGTVTAPDGPDWSGDYGQYVSGTSSTYNTGDSVTLDSSVPSGTPSSVFQSELYGGQQWEFSDGIQSGQTYEVRLYFAEIFHTEDGLRTFDVAVEGSQVLDDYDIHAEVGHDVGVMESFTVTPDDGQIDVDLSTVEDNAKISAIEIVDSEPEPDTLGGPSDVDFGSVVVGDSETETVTLTNLGGDGDADITITDVSVSGDSAFSAGSASQTTLAPGESADVPVTFTPDDAQANSGTLEVDHSGSNSPLSVALSGEGTSTAEVGFGKSDLQGFNQGQLTALEFGPDGRLYVAQQSGIVYALNITRDGENSYSVESQESIDVIQDIPNHDDFGTYTPGETNRQITGLTVGGTASEPVVYVSSSDPEIDVGEDDDDTDTNSGSISRLTFDWGSGDALNGVDHDVMVLGLPRSEENHATNGLDLSDDGETLYVAQGGHTNQGAPSNNFGHTSEYALSAAVLEIDLAQIEQNYQSKALQSYDGSYPNLDFWYAIPTIQNDDATDGDDLPFGGNDGINQAKWVEDGPVQVYSPGYRNPYDLVLSADDQLYVIDNGPNGGWGDQPVDEGPSGICTNEPNDTGGGSGDQLHLATQGSYGGHPAPIRANPTGADIYDADGNVAFDINDSNSPVPASLVNPIECDYQSPAEDNSIGDEFGWTGGMDEYTASNFGGSMEGDLLVVVGSSSVERVQLDASGTAVTDQESNFFSDISALGIAAQGDEGPFPGTVWTARGDLTVFEPNDYDGSDTGGEQCTGADDASLDEDGDGYDNADEIDAGSDPCSAASTPADFDDDGTSNLNDPDDDNDGQPDTSDPFAVDPDDGTTTMLPIQMDLSETQLFGENGQGWTGLMTNGQTDYQGLYDPDEMTVGGAAQVLTVENVPTGDATQDDQQFAFQRGFDAPDEPFTVSTTVNGLPENPSDFQGVGIYIGNGDQDNYLKLITAANGGSGGIQFGGETDGGFQTVEQPDDSAVAGPGSDTDLEMTVYPSNNTVEAYYTPENGEETFVGSTTIPESWLDSSDGSGTAVGVISTSYNAGSTFDATWTNLDVEYVNPPANQPPVADAGADATVDAGQQVTLDASGSTDPDGDDGALGYTWTQTAGTPDGLLDMSDGEQVPFTAPDVDSETTFTFEVSVSDGQDSDTDAVNVTVQPTDDGPTDGEVVHRLNTGGDEVAATDDGPVWAATDDTSEYLAAGGDVAGPQPYTVGDVDDSVPSNTPTAVFETEMYDPVESPEMLWTLPAQSGETYEVRLYFHDGYTGTSEPGDRVFDVAIEDEQVLTDFDIIAEYGDNTAAMESFEVTPSDDTIDIEFLHGQAENPQINAIEIVAVGDGTGGEMTVAEAVAVGGENDSQIEDAEIQQAINWWSTDAEVPNTGGQTIGDSEIQSLINLWATDASVGDGGDDGDGGDTIASSLVEITPDSGNVDASTYGGGTYQVTNTGEENISSVSFDLSTATLPDMVFDPQGTAGDPTGEGLNIASDGGTGITTAEGGSEAFSQPHNGQNADDGYDVMTVEFADFENGETATFWADNDPTSIKGATVGSQEAGPVSGLELARSTVTVTYEDGTTQTTQLMGDGSDGGATAVVTDDEATAPTVDAEGVALDAGILDGYHSGATVSDAGQTVSVTGEPGETVTLVRVEAELALSNVPDGGYDIEELEANNALDVEYDTVTLDSNGEASVPVTLTDAPDDDDEAGFNYFVAAQGDPSGDMGLASNVIVLHYDESAGDGDPDQPGDVAFAVNAGGDEYTASDGTVYQADTNFDGGSTYSTTEAIDGTQDDELYQTERYGGAPGSAPLSYDVPVDNGEYEVTLHFAEIFQGVADSDSPDSTGPEDGTNENDRLFNVSIEGEQVLTDYDIFAEVGPLTATQESFTTEVTDGELNLDFAATYDNAKVSAIEVTAVDSGDDNAAPTIDAIADQTVTEGESVTVPISADDPDGDSLLLAVNGSDFVNLSNGELTIAPESGDAGTYTVDVTADDGTGGTATESFQVTVEEADDPPSAQTLHRVNAGEGTTVSATDDGPDWTGVADTSSPYLASVATTSADNYCGGDEVTPGGDVPSSTPDGIWDCERYGNSTWEFSVDAGADVDVRLYFANSFPGASDPGDRQFNVSIEDEQVLMQYDPVAEAGHATGTMEEFTATDDGDGTLTIEFENGAAENAEIRAIEIIESGGSS